MEVRDHLLDCFKDGQTIPKTSFEHKNDSNPFKVAKEVTSPY
jgi:invasion protein IalB